MGIGSKLEQLLKLRGSNVNKLSIATGINVGTIYSIIRRDNTKVDLDDLQKICNVLGVDLDYFVENTVSAEIDSDEIALLEMFHLLNEEGKKKLLDNADDLVQSGKYKKRVAATKNDEKTFPAMEISSELMDFTEQIFRTDKREK